MVRHVRKYHSESAKRKVTENAELDRMELLHADKIPRLTVGDDDQTGGTVRGTKRVADDDDDKPQKKTSRSLVDYSDTSDDEEIESENEQPLFVATVKKLGPAKRWKKNVVINQKFNMTLDQQRPPQPNEDLNIGATHAIAVAADQLIDELNIPENYLMTLQIGSKEHQREGLSGETWKVPVGNFTERAAMTQTLLNHLSHVLNSGEFITRDTGFSASLLFMRPELKGGKGGDSPGSKIWSKMTNKRSILKINNTDELCCARALVVMREYVKHQAGEPNTFHTIRQNRGRNSHQLKEARLLHTQARVPEGLCGLEEIDQFQDFLGPRGYRIMVLEASRGGLIFTGDKYREAEKTISIVKSVYVDEHGQETAHFDGVTSIKGFMNKSYFCSKCCKGYNTEDPAHHQCLAKKCPGCKQDCPDYALWKKPDRSCTLCKREFYGETCFKAHLIAPKYELDKKEEDVSATEEEETVSDSEIEDSEIEDSEIEEEVEKEPEEGSTCDKLQRCIECMATHKVIPGLPHKCYHAFCKHCLDYVDVNNHRCYITSEEEKTNKQAVKKLIKSKQGKDAPLTDVIINGLKTERQRKLTRLQRLNQGVPQTQLDLEDREAEAIETLIKKKVPRDQITPEMIEAHLPSPPTLDADRIVFADIECVLDDSNTFVPTLICYTLGRSEQVFHHWGPKCISEFLQKINEHVGKTEKRKRGGKLPDYTVFFHNLKGFDGVLTLNTMYNLNLKVTNQMGTGTKVLHFKHGNLVFKDSLNFLNMPLASFPRTFGLTDMKKGFFPHKFSKQTNLEYEGPIPALSYFEPQHMSEDKKKECEDWHAEQIATGVTWNFKKEMLEYCKDDVRILREGCLKFAQDTLEEAKFNPLEQCITIASTCHYFWRNHQMLPKTIAIEPIHGWGGPRIAQSKVALQWLYLEDKKLGRENRIKHTRNGGEQALQVKGGKVYVDGYDTQTKTAYEFHGCQWHGCPKCKPTKRHEKSWNHPDRTVEAVYQATLRKTELLKEAGYNVVEQWECEFKRMLKQFPLLQEQVNTMTWITPLEPRDAFFGGRTGLAKCYYQTAEGEEIHYKDVTSLYPYINKYGTYPVGHPQIQVNPSDQSISNYFGIAKVDVLPPEELLHPVLPVKHNNKLLFPLCLQCVKDQEERPWFERTNLCPHTDEERKITGTWCTPELEKAIEKGYRILRIHEVWHFPPSQRKTGLFEPYVNQWLKHKTEASGWPGGVTTEEEKASYVKQYKEREGIQLNPEQIQKNPGRKQVAKLMLNSFWGKFGENELRPQTTTISDVSTWQKLINDESIIVKDVRIFNDDVMEVSTIKYEDANASGGKVNVFIACFTTALARLKLYSELEKLDNQVLYYDTDSVIYSWREGQTKIPTGLFLGEMTDEIGGDIITEFGSAGPKSYCYTTRGGKSECKNKGTKSSFEINQVLNCESMMNHIKHELVDPQEERRLMEINIKNHFIRNNTEKTVSLINLIKIFGINWDKRVTERGTGASYPYGYVRM